MSKIGDPCGENIIHKIIKAMNYTIHWEPSQIIQLLTYFLEKGHDINNKNFKLTTPILYIAATISSHENNPHYEKIKPIFDFFVD